MSEMEWLETFAGNLQYIMEERKFSQSYLSRVADVSQSTISRYLSGEQMPSVRAIINIAYALGCDIADLTDFGDAID